MFLLNVHVMCCHVLTTGMSHMWFFLLFFDMLVINVCLKSRINTNDERLKVKKRKRDSLWFQQLLSLLYTAGSIGYQKLCTLVLNLRNFLQNKLPVSSCYVGFGSIYTI